uniref:Cytochrome P450 n=1 Tax=Fagus sylvatica TaxID=28930 RepID=A0A2N9H773_FAGSY
MWSWWWGGSNEKDELSRATLTALVSIFSVLVWLLWAAKKSRKIMPPLPPGPRGLPIVGYLPFLGTDLHRKFEELAGVYGPIYKVWLGQKLCVVVNSPSLVKEVVRDQDTIFANRGPPIAALIASFGGIDIPFSAYGPDWRTLRKIFVKQLLSNANLNNSYSIRNREIKKSIRYVYDKIGTPIDIGELAFMTVVNVLMSLAWGDTLQGEEGAKFSSEFKKSLGEITTLMGKPNISDFFPVLARFDLQGIEKQTMKISQWLGDIHESAIEKRTNSDKSQEEGTGKIDRKDFLQFLLEIGKKEDGATSLTINQVKVLLFDVVVGGADTTTTAVEWVMMELLYHPEVMRKVYEELAEIVGLNNLVEESHLPKLHYLDAVIKETFRLRPPLPFLLPRAPSQSTTIGGYYVPKDTRVMLNVWAIHRDPKLWENPLEFQPERFLNDPGKFDFAGNNFEYLPFGSGRRICAGTPLAVRNYLYIIASFVHSFEWKLPQGTEMDSSDLFGVVLKKLKPIVAIPTPRLSNLELYTK